jgi:hypothetical protein
MTRQLGLVRVTAQAGTPQTNKISHNWRPRIRHNVHRIPRRQVVHSQPFELGEDAPGTGEYSKEDDLPGNSLPVSLVLV